MFNIYNLSFNYKDQPLILDGFSAEYEKGDIIAVKGPSGSGKTTVLHLFCGVIPKIFKGDLRGRITILNEDIESFLLQELAPHVSILMQQPDYQLFFPIVEQELSFAPENLKENPQEIERRITNALEILEITHLRHAVTNQLSFGQKKMVALASVLTLNPKILLLDEPTAGLSQSYIDVLQRLIISLSKQGKIIVIADHNPELLDLASKEIVLGN